MHYALFATAIGDCGIAWRGQQVVATSLPAASPTATVADLAGVSGGAEAEPTPAIQHAIDSMVALLQGQNVDLKDIDCDLTGCDEFAFEVYRHTRNIPPGETRTYGDIATLLGNIRFSQAVGRVLGKNPIPIIVPCHRVVGANGKLTGFSAPGGVHTKQRMLAIEGALIASQRDLFDDQI